MKAIRCDLPETLPYAEIHVLADLHKGDPHCDESAIKERIKAISENENVYAVINGDIINWSSKTSIGDIYGETLTPMEQIQYFTDLLKPIIGKILSITPGNHEYRAYRQEGIDITRLIARQLGIEDRYSETSALLFIRLGRNADGKSHNRKILYTAYVNHGSGGGRKEGAKAIRLADMASIVDADIYLHSHTHLPMIMREMYFRTDTANSAVTKVDKLFINTGATLDYGGYGEAGEFKPASKESPVIRIDGTVKRATATL